MLAAAVANNVTWCTEVVGGVVDDDVWTAGSRRVPFFPDVITVRPCVNAADVVAGEPSFVKDSYADLDLAPFGYDLLFTASWLGSTPATGADEDDWSTAADLATWCRAAGVPELATVTLSSTVLAREDHAAGAIATVGAGVVGVSNVFGSPWSQLPGVVGRRFPGLPVVGYEHGADLDAAVAAGFAVLGPLRVWQRR